MNQPLEHLSSIAALIAVDWGTTNFRAFLLDDQGRQIQETFAPMGLLSLKKDEFEAELMSHIGQWVKDKPLPVIMAGMVGSNQGWQDAGYLNCPAHLPQSAKQLCYIDNNAGLTIAIVPGVKCQTKSLNPDVMRGEEVQVFGAMTLLEQEGGVLTSSDLSNIVFCLPGTHSKWVKVDKNSLDLTTIVELSTHMTGEMFNIVLQHSILGRDVDLTSLKQASDTDIFLQGVHTSQRQGGLLNHLFSARSLRLDNRLKTEQVASYISGLLIGAELNAIATSFPDVKHIYLIGNSQLNELYREALLELGFLATQVNSAKASALGMIAIAKQAGII